MQKEITNYINKQPSPQKEILKKVRKIILETLPVADEKMAWGVITYSNNKFYIAGMKNRVHIGFARKGLNKKEIELFEGTGKTMRHIKIHSPKEVDEKELVKLIKLVDKKTVCESC